MSQIYLALLILCCITCFGWGLDRITAAQFKQDLGIESGRQVLLLFGELSRRKALFKVLEAIPQLFAETTEKICLFLAGLINESQRSSIEAEIGRLQTSFVQIIVRDRYLREQDVQHCFETADIVLATYHRQGGIVRFWFMPQRHTNL